MPTYKVLSKDEIRAGFTYPTLTKIVGEPTYETLDNLQNELIRNASTCVQRTAPGQGHAGLAEFAAQYNNRTGQVYNRPPQIGPPPPIIVGQVQQNAQNLHNYELMKQDCAIADNVEGILLAQLENAIENAYLASLHDVAHGFAGRSVLDVLTELYRLFGSISAQKVNTMLHRMTEPVDPNAPISIAFKQIDDAAKYIAASGRAVAPNTIVNAAETVLMQTGRYKDAFRRWIPQDPTQKTYHHLKNFFTDEYRLLNQLQETTQGAGYNVEAPIDEESLGSAVQDFAAANASDRAAFETITQSNAMLAQQLSAAMQGQQAMQAQMAQLQQQFCMAAMGNNNPQQRPPNRRNQQQPRGPFPAPQQMYPPAQQQPGMAQPNRQPYPPMLPAPPMQQMQQPMPHMPFFQQQPPQFQQQQPQFQQQQQQQQQQPFQRGNGPRRPPGAKRYQNQNYCWSHGFDIADNHHSGACRQQRHGHQGYATRHNPMNGCQKNLNKIWMGDFQH
jgi:hypothetical protein